MTSPTEDPLAFATFADLQARLDWTLDTPSVSVAINALSDASNWARFYGAPWPDPAAAPPLVKVTVLGACTRFMRNPDGYVQSRAADETVVWSDTHSQGGSVTFTEAEQQMFAHLAGNAANSLQSADGNAWGTAPWRYRNGRREDEWGWVLTPDGMKRFPMFGGDDW